MKWKKIDIIDFLIEKEEKFKEAVKRLKERAMEISGPESSTYKFWAKEIDKIMGEDLVR